MKIKKRWKPVQRSNSWSLFLAMVFCFSYLRCFCRSLNLSKFTYWKLIDFLKAIGKSPSLFSLRGFGCNQIVASLNSLTTLRFIQFVLLFTVARHYFSFKLLNKIWVGKTILILFFCDWVNNNSKYSSDYYSKNKNCTPIIEWKITNHCHSNDC